jgi:hypothetical protein
MFDHATDDIPFTGNRTNDRNLVIGAAWAFPLVSMPILIFSADVRFVHFHFAHELQTCLLGDFFDVDGLANQALEVLRDPAPYRALGRAGCQLVDAKYSLDRTYPRFLKLVQNTLQSTGSRHG